MAAENKPDRTIYYAARLDAHLPTLPDDAARRAFLTSQLNFFERKYGEFQNKVDAGRDVGDQTAWDYVLSMSEITGRLALLQEPAHG